jgi:hypothetical protein
MIKNYLLEATEVNGYQKLIIGSKNINDLDNTVVKEFVSRISK